ncbi:hypothetical protein M8756_19410, partial [Lutimaribacter sp. EGI FJ00015]|nr:hypothetical protein [Lutimaribacter sp. EGI FJ00015]
PPQSAVGSLLDLASERKKKRKDSPPQSAVGSLLDLDSERKKHKRLPTRICGGESFRLRKKKEET